MEDEKIIFSKEIFNTIKNEDLIDIGTGKKINKRVIVTKR